MALRRRIYWTLNIPLSVLHQLVYMEYSHFQLALTDVLRMVPFTGEHFTEGRDDGVC